MCLPFLPVLTISGVCCEDLYISTWSCQSCNLFLKAFRDEASTHNERDQIVVHRPTHDIKRDLIKIQLFCGWIVAWIKLTMDYKWMDSCLNWIKWLISYHQYNNNLTLLSLDLQASVKCVNTFNIKANTCAISEAQIKYLKYLKHLKTAFLVPCSSLPACHGQVWKKSGAGSCQRSQRLKNWVTQIHFLTH